MSTTTIPPPTTQDGRNLDRSIADEHGEGASIEVEIPGEAWPVSPDAHPAPDTAPSETYYDLPVVKAAPWRWYVPVYIYCSGVAGAAASLAVVAELGRDRALARRLHWIATIGEGAGSALLIADLGRPAKFYNMLRVFRPTSPMNLGAWILSAAGLSGGLALLGDLRGRDRISIASITGALAGSMLSTYTGVLIGNTAVPVWSSTRRRMPLWFAATSAASLGSVIELVGPERPGTRIYSGVAKAAELAAAVSIERAADAAGVGRPLREGRSGRMWRTARWLGAASLVATILPWGGRGRSVVAGVLGTASAVLGRLAIIEAGRASAADPRATFEPQRRSPVVDAAAPAQRESSS